MNTPHPNLPDILARLAAIGPDPWVLVPGADSLGRLSVVVRSDPEPPLSTSAPFALLRHVALTSAAFADLIAHAPADLAALAARVAALEAECATQRATLADPRVVRVLEQIGHAENDAVDFINASPYRADIVARLTELSDGQPRPFDGGIDRTLLRLGLDCGGPDTIVANPSAFRVLARLTVSTEATP